MYSLKSHNTFGVEARCNRFIEYTNETELIRTVFLLRDKGETRILHIGGGSNLLFTGDYDGTILHSAIQTREVIADNGKEVLLRVGSGHDWDSLVQWTLENGMYGLENLSLIPGEVGAGAVQNIGAYGKEAGHFIERVEAIAANDGTRRTFTNEECQYAYRSSVFKHELNGQYYITHVTYRLSRKFHADLTYRALIAEVQRRGLIPDALTAHDVRALVCELRRAKLPDPKETGSAGSFFMNPVVSAEKADALSAQYPDMPRYPADGGVKIPAAWLIEQAGWKGRSKGRAGVWPHQALVLVNLGGATGEEIAALSREIQTDVQARFGIALQPEAIFI